MPNAAGYEDFIGAVAAVLSVLGSSPNWRGLSALSRVIMTFNAAIFIAFLTFKGWNVLFDFVVLAYLTFLDVGFRFDCLRMRAL